MKFYNSEGLAITKQSASASVLALYKNGTKLDCFVDYHGVTAEVLAGLDADSVHFYCNHAGNSGVSLSVSHHHKISRNIQLLNAALKL